MLITIVFTVLLLPMTTVLLPPSLCSIVTVVVLGFVTTVSLITGFFTGGTVIFGFCAGFFSHGQRFVRADSQSSRRSWTTANESVNLRFSRIRLLITNSAQSQLQSYSVVFWFLQPANNTIAAVKGRAKRVKICLFVIFLNLWLDKLNIKLDKANWFVK